MLIVPALILIPFITGLLILAVRHRKIIGGIVRAGAAATLALTVYAVITLYSGAPLYNFADTEWVNTLLLTIEVLAAVYILYIAVRHKNWWILVFTLIQVPLIV